MTYSPIVLFVYNRPTHTRQTVEALQKNALAVESDLIIFSDAPKDETQEQAVSDVRQYIHKIDGFKSVTIVERETNLGLAKSIIGGVTSIVNERGRIIVLEDDLTVTPHFLDYMNRALDTYESEQKVIQISGYMFPVKLEIKEDALFLPLTTSWGWATWKRAWDLFDPDAKGYARVKTDLALRKRFNLNGAYDYFSMLEAQLAGRVDSWAIRWYLSTFMLEALTLYPRMSLIINTGFDGSGTHGELLETRSFYVSQSDFSSQKPSLPETVAVSREWDVIRLKIFPGMSSMQKIKTLLKSFFRLVTSNLPNQINAKTYMAFIKSIYHKLKSLYFIWTGMKPWSRGYSEYKALNIQKMLSKGDFDPVRLSARYGYRLDERIIEYPWFFSRLPSHEGKLLDAGSVLNFSYIQSHPNLKSKNVFISTLAPEGICFWRQGVSYVFEDLRNSCFRDNYFDWVASLSTIEHIGLDNTMLYTDDVSKNENYSSSYMAAVMEYHRMLKPGGILYLSFPYGKHENRKWFQIFDGAMIDEIIAAFRPSKQQAFYYKYESDGWKVSTREEAKDATYFDIHTQPTYDADYAAASRAIVCLELVK